MAILEIVRFPSPLLRAQCKAVEAFDARLETLAADLTDTMRAAPGIGITAAHVGILQRLTVMELDGPGSTRVYVNPVVILSSPAFVRHTEGSVSMPGVTDEVERPAHVRVRFQDLQGNEQAEDVEGLLAVCLQHEIDQLNGIFWIDRLSRLKRERIIKKFRKIPD